MCDEVFSLALLAFGTALLHSAPMELETVFIIMWLVGVVCGLALSACRGHVKDNGWRSIAPVRTG